MPPPRRTPGAIPPEIARDPNRLMSRLEAEAFLSMSWATIERTHPHLIVRPSRSRKCISYGSAVAISRMHEAPAPFPVPGLRRREKDDAPGDSASTG
jgi:hypothetical protein